MPMPQGSPQDLVLCLPLSPVMLEVVEHMPVPMGFCLLYPSPNHSITVRTQAFFLKVSIGLPLNLPQFMSYFRVCWVSQALTLSSYPWLVLLRLRSKPDVGWETPGSERAHNTHCSELTQIPPSENVTVLIRNALCLPLIKPFTGPEHSPCTEEVIVVKHCDTCNTWLASMAHCHLGFP